MTTIMTTGITRFLISDKVSTREIGWTQFDSNNWNPAVSDWV